MTEMHQRSSGMYYMVCCMHAAYLWLSACRLISSITFRRLSLHPHCTRSNQIDINSIYMFNRIYTNFCGIWAYNIWVLIRILRNVRPSNGHCWILINMPFVRDICLHGIQYYMQYAVIVAWRPVDEPTLALLSVAYFAYINISILNDTLKHVCSICRITNEPFTICIRRMDTWHMIKILLSTIKNLKIMILNYEIDFCRVHFGIPRWGRLEQKSRWSNDLGHFFSFVYDVWHIGHSRCQTFFVPICKQKTLKWAQKYQMPGLVSFIARGLLQDIQFSIKCNM